MKIKQYVFITDPDDFLKGDYHTCFSVYGDNDNIPDSWSRCGEIELDINVDTGEIINKTVAALDAEIEKEREIFTKRLQQLESRKNDLLAISHDN